MQQYEILRTQNDYLSELIGKTYNRKTLNIVNSFYRERFEKYSVRTFNKFSLVTCLENARKNREILSIGGSSLLLHKKTGVIEPNLILDNYGHFLAVIFSGAGAGGALAMASMKDTTNTAYAGYVMRMDGVSTGLFNLVNGVNMGSYIQMGSGLNAPARADYAIQTPLGAAPESGQILTNQGAYTASNTIIYQGDANPTGGSGTVNEIATIMAWVNTVGALKNIMVAHDAISPGVAYLSGKLLRGSYTWTI